MHRLETANLGIHDFPDTQGLAVWWAANGATAGASVHHKLVIVQSLEAVYPMPSTPPSVPGKVTVQQGSVQVSITHHPWGNAAMPASTGPLA